MQRWIVVCSLALPLVVPAVAVAQDAPRVVLWATSSFARRDQRPQWSYVVPKTYPTEAACYAAGAAQANAETKRGWTGLVVSGLSVYGYPLHSRTMVPVFEARCLPVGVIPNTAVNQ